MKQIQMTNTPSFSLISTKKIIQMNDVSTSYDSKNFALDHINLSIDRGTNYAIVGQSGSGKSTLLKLMNGMMIPSNGTIKIDYMTPNMNEKKFKKMMHTIGYIPQNLGLVKNLTVLENVIIGCLPRLSKIQSMFKKFPENEVSEAKKIIKQVGLSGKEDRKAYMLSGGEKRRVAIARALMQKPKILLADEIVSELDHVTAREIMDLIADAQKRINLTAIMVHHDMQLALEYANRVAVIKEGNKVLEIGVEGDKIVDFQTGNMTTEEIMEMYSDDTKK
ncbi:phosphonate ABC transporter ATP-binding protein [Nitrosopumilus sp.]|uniref:phosphonate ABC transporter ATP-binding protein n=1 Tax=Nitrosopumilus sp. TaxID=2024843 RepID=UPI00261B365B|nr:ATP-binding cassette domain-containing protein [Nitrosopumilus sp.]